MTNIDSQKLEWLYFMKLKEVLNSIGISDNDMWALRKLSYNFVKYYAHYTDVEALYDLMKKYENIKCHGDESGIHITSPINVSIFE